jgi:outer membrane biogenesis lipoprotein LolB
MSKFIPAIFAAFLLTACNISTANLSDVMSCTETQDVLCAEDITTFATDTPEIYVSALLNNAPEGTLTTFSWRYITDDYHIDSITLESVDTATTLQSSLNMPTEGWPVGEYEVVLSINTDNSEPVHKKFSIK